MGNLVLEKLESIENELDKLNGDYGNLCLYCNANIYNSKVGIVHSIDCVIPKIREIIKNIKLENGE